MTSNIQCPHCECRLKVKEKLIGKDLPCPRCGVSFNVPDFLIEKEINEDIFAPEEEPPAPNPKPKPKPKNSAPALPPRRKSKAAKDAEKRRKAKKTIEDEEEPVTEKPAIAVKIPAVPKQLVVGLAVMVCGILVGLLAWNFLQSDSSDADTMIASDDTADHNAAADENGHDTDGHDAGEHDADGHGADGHDAGGHDAEEEYAKTMSGHDAEQKAGAAKAAKDTKKASDKNASDSEKKSEVAKTSPPKAQKVRTHEETIAYLKEATVFVKVTTSEGGGSGSGFLLEADNGRGLIVTNAHVIDPEDGKLEKVECVFHSGSREEFTVRSTVVGKDDAADLAVLSVSDKRLPAPLDPIQDVKLLETMPVLILGFPFGEVLTTSSRNPAITISKGTVSSIRRDDFDQLSFLQIDGGINPGNSGGPVVTEDGTLVGISVAKLRGTEIGMAIPQQTLASTIRGRVTYASMSAVEKGNMNEYTASVALMDPRRQIKSAHILICPADKAKNAAPDKTGAWQRVSKDMQKADLKISDGNFATTKFAVIRRSGGSVFQVLWVLNDGTEHLTAPANCDEVDLSALAGARLGDRKSLDVAALPNIMSDFAMNPINGDIATLDPKNNKAYLLNAKELTGKLDLENVKTADVGKTPVAVTYKQYKDKGYFAVVCTQDSHMYLIDAETFQMLQKIPLLGEGVAAVTSSLNPDDPFLYYNHGSGHDSSLAAVDVRDMVDRGNVLDQAMDTEISADGRTAYRRGPWSPSGFESLGMTSELDAKTPSFSRMVHDHRASEPYVPGPFGQKTAVGNRLYSGDLSRLLGTVKFVPQCFFRSRPVVVGLDGNRLRAASYNSHQGVGITIKLPPFLVAPGEALPRGVNSKADFKRVGLNMRMLADDANERVIFAFRNLVMSVPLESFQIPDEPYMVVKINRNQLKVGEKTDIKLSTLDPRVKITLKDPPAGAEITEDGMSWTPTGDKIGSVSVPISLSFDGNEHTIQADFRISQSFREAPFKIGGMTVAEDAEQAVCWTSWIDQYGRAIQTTDNNGNLGHYIGVVSLNGDAAATKKKLPFAIRQGIVVGKHVAVLPSTENTRVEVYDTTTMKRVKTLLTATAMSRISTSEGNLLLHTNGNVDVYSMKTFKRVRSLGGNSANAGRHYNNGNPTNLFKDGVIVNGVLFNASGKKPKLIVAPSGIQVLSGGDSKLYSGSFLRRHPVAQNQNHHHNRNGNFQLGPIEIPGKDLTVMMQQTTTTTRQPGNSRAYVINKRIILTLTDNFGDIVSRVTLVEEDSNQNIQQQSSRNRAASRPQMQVVGSTVYIADGDRIYDWSADSLPQREENRKDDVEFHVVPEQTEFALRSTRTELRHSVLGGSAPYEYFLFTRLDGVTMNEQTGIVSVDQDQLLESAMPILARYARGATDLAGVNQRLQEAMISTSAQASKLIGRKTRGLPVGIPIRFKVIDSDGAVAEMQYFVVMEISLRTAAGKIWAMQN